jgi:hypothetical protein
MGGDSSSLEEGEEINEDEEGIIPRALKSIFSILDTKQQQGAVASIRVSMTEIYNEECRDLLHPEVCTYVPFPLLVFFVHVIIFLFS